MYDFDADPALISSGGKAILGFFGIISCLIVKDACSDPSKREDN